ncbi:MAG: hypothetical protein R3D59_09265 [Paracoccaceae bacterium]
MPAPALVALVIAGILALVIHEPPTAAIRSPSARRNWPPSGWGFGWMWHLFTFRLTGVLAGLAGFIDIARYQTTVITGHANDALQAVAAVVIGGTLMEGGRSRSSARQA